MFIVCFGCLCLSFLTLCPQSSSSNISPQHIVLDYDFNDTGSGSGSGSGDLGADFEEPCDVEHIMTADLQQVFLPVVYALIFTLGITGNGLVVIVLGCQRR